MSNARKKVLVTGGCGFIGSHLVDKLLSEGYDLCVIDNLTTGLKRNVNERACYFFEDINSYKENSGALEKIILGNQVEIVCHLAACTNIRESIEDPLSVYETNVLASIAIANVCKKNGIKKFIFASTSAVYGEPEYFPVDEIHPTRPMSAYGLSKLAFEQYLECTRNRSMSVTVLRLPNVYGPRQRPDLEGGVVAIFYDKMKHDQDVTFYGDGTQSRDWVHVHDIVDGFAASLTSDYKEFDLFSLGSNTGTQLRELHRYFTEIFECKKAPVLAEVRNGDIKHMVMSGKKANQVLHWKPKIDVKMGVRSLLEEQS